MTGQPQFLVLDASCLLNLYATGRLRAIAAALPYRLAVAEYVLEREVLYTWLPVATGSGARREPVDTSSLQEDGRIQVMRLELPEEEATFVSLAGSIDDGEAVTGALALHRRCALATDDRKARRVFGERLPGIPLVSTLEILKLWEQEASVSGAELRAAILSMRSGASYVPGRRDPLYAWWREVMYGSAP